MKIKEFKLENLWVFVIIVMCFAYVSSMPVDQYDFWHYIKTGQIGFNSHEILNKEIFTFTALNTDYINLHWTSQFIYFFLYSMGGIPLLIFLHATVITLTFLLVFKLCLDSCGNLRIASIATLVSIILSVTNFALRPQEFSILFFSLAFYLLKKRKYKFLPLLFLIWVNTHGAFVLGLLLLMVFWLGEIRIKNKFDLSPRLFFVFLISLLMTLFTPWGLKLYLTILHAESQNLSVLVTEWFPPSLHSGAGFVFFVVLISFFILQNFTAKNWERTDIFLFIVFAVFALRSQRAIIWWAIVTAPAFASALNSFLLSLKKDVKAEESNNPVSNLILAFFIFTYAFFCLPWFKQYIIFLPEIKRPLISRNTPVELGKQLAHLADSHKIYNNFSWGSYFMWSLRDDQKIFITPWLSVFSKEVIRDYLRISNCYSTWSEVLSKYKVDTLALSKDEQLELISQVNSSSGWKKIYEDKLGVIFKKIK